MPSAIPSRTSKSRRHAISRRARAANPARVPQRPRPADAPADLGRPSDLDRFLSIDPQVVADIIAEGIFSSSGNQPATRAIEQLANAYGADVTVERLHAFARRLEQAGVSTNIPSGDDGDDDFFDDVVMAPGGNYGHAGFLVGLAVGLALGSDQPFAGVRRPPAASAGAARRR